MRLLNSLCLPYSVWNLNLHVPLQCWVMRGPCRWAGTLLRSENQQGQGLWTSTFSWSLANGRHWWAPVEWPSSDTSSWTWIICLWGLCRWRGHLSCAPWAWAATWILLPVSSSSYFALVFCLVIKMTSCKFSGSRASLPQSSCFFPPIIRSLRRR